MYRPSKVGLSVVTFAALLFLSVADTVSADIPRFMAWSGRLSDGTGLGQSTVVDLTVSLYDAAEGGNLVWRGRHPAVPLVDGYFTVNLGLCDAEGTCDPSPANAGFPADLPSGTWMSIGVDDGLEAAPRRPLGSVPFAMRAALADRSLQSDKATSASLAVESDGLTAPAMAKLDARYAALQHDHKGKYVGAGEANSVGSTMVQDGSLEPEDLAFSPYIQGKDLTIPRGTRLTFGAEDNDNGYLQEVTQPNANDYELRLTLEDDGDHSEKFSVYSFSWGGGTQRRHEFRADGYAYHAGNLEVGGRLTAGSGLALECTHKQVNAWGADKGVDVYCDPGWARTGCAYYNANNGADNSGPGVYPVNNGCHCHSWHQGGIQGCYTICCRIQ